jgi:hypothetical protein
MFARFKKGLRIYLNSALFSGTRVKSTGHSPTELKALRPLVDYIWVYCRGRSLSPQGGK